MFIRPVNIDLSMDKQSDLLSEINKFKTQYIESNVDLSKIKQNQVDILHQIDKCKCKINSVDMYFNYKRRSEFKKPEIVKLKKTHLEIFNFDPLRLKIILPSDLIFYGKNKSSKKYITMGVVKYGSPLNHFDNEQNSLPIPYIIDFGVIPKFQGNGIGHTFFNFIIKILSTLNHKFINLDIHYELDDFVENSTLYKFYSKLGFKFVGKFKHPNSKIYLSMSYEI